MADSLKSKSRRENSAPLVQNDLESEEYTEEENGTDEENDLPPPKIPKKVIIDNDEDLSEYEKQMLKVIAKNQEKLRELGLNVPQQYPGTNLQPKSKSKNGKNEKTKYTKREIPSVLNNLPRREPSKRLRNKLENKTFDGSEMSSVIIKSTTIREPKIDRRILDTVDFEVESRELFSNLHSSLPYKSDVDIMKCDSSIYQTQILSLRMSYFKKVVDKRIYSLFIYPCTSKCLILAGSLTGSLGIWDVMSDKNDNMLQFNYNTGPINCISASINSMDKIYTTSHDGTIKCINIDSGKIENLYATSFSDNINHLTWHHEMDSHTLLFAHGNGNVGILDIREKSKVTWINCYNRSCRTVQSHPRDTNYFLTSSSLGFASIFDIRNTRKNKLLPVSEMKHNKGLTSAFFSHLGNSVLTTCNDDTIKIFDTSQIVLQPKKNVSVVHNNHTGQWLSVFKAMWYPQREDAFLVGSLMFPRRVYGNDGRIIAELKDESMTTISPVVAIHPTLPIIAGGNSSGRVHLFGPPEMAKMYQNVQI